VKGIDTQVVMDGDEDRGGVLRDCEKLAPS
jgi:hypothetical protein